jgi:hypothetical protein
MEQGEHVPLIQSAGAVAIDFAVVKCPLAAIIKENDSIQPFRPSEGMVGIREGNDPPQDENIVNESPRSKIRQDEAIRCDNPGIISLRLRSSVSKNQLTLSNGAHQGRTANSRRGNTAPIKQQVLLQPSPGRAYPATGRRQVKIGKWLGELSSWVFVFSQGNFLDEYQDYIVFWVGIMADIPAFISR